MKISSSLSHGRLITLSVISELGFPRKLRPPYTLRLSPRWRMIQTGKLGRLLYLETWTRAPTGNFGQRVRVSETKLKG